MFHTAETETDKKWVDRIVWRCSYCTATDVNAGSNWVLWVLFNSICVCLGVRHYEPTMSGALCNWTF